MNIRLIYNHIEHHAQHSGYDMMAQFSMGSDYVYGPLYRFAQKWITWKHLKKYPVYRSTWYGGDKMRRELEVIGRSCLPRRMLFHFYYAENDLRISSRWKWRWNNKIVASFHQPPQFLDSHIENKDYIRGLDAAMVVAKSQMGYMAQFLPEERIFHVPHGVHVQYWCPDPELPREAIPTFVFVGVWLRDLEMTKATIRRVAELGIEVSFKLITTQDMHEQFKGLPNTELLSSVSDEKLLDTYRRAHALFLPLNLSTANNAILEAMSCGTAVISTNSGGIPEYVDASCGILVEPGDVEAAAQAIRSLCEDRQKVDDLGRGARARAEEFAWEKVGETMNAAYRKILA